MKRGGEKTIQTSISGTTSNSPNSSYNSPLGVIEDNLANTVSSTKSDSSHTAEILATTAVVAASGVAIYALAKNQQSDTPKQ